MHSLILTTILTALRMNTLIELLSKDVMKVNVRADMDLESTNSGMFLKIIKD